jgi:hypothetical protein
MIGNLAGVGRLVGRLPRILPGQMDMISIRTVGFESGVFAVVRTLIAAVTFSMTLASSAVLAVDPILLTPELNAEIVTLLNSRDHPLPVVPVVVGKVDTRAQVEALIAPGQRPIIFQIANASGPYFSLAKVWMFSEIALEYPNIVAFAKVPAGSEAAKALYPHEVTKPVYMTVDPAKGPSQVPMFKFDG